ncbi:MAG: hypothetical protein A2V66_02800 [Ignavibacteria bacterium RBG_13_36_8]|nr:MAG: hypothetical protein A2V66_02800 [Ignavibacteria bacterium RBG_13_36_8]
MRVLIIILIAMTNIMLAQLGNLTGQITDAVTQEKLTGANISVAGTYLNTTTNLSGKYIINKIPIGSYTLIISHIGYKTERIEFSVEDNITKEWNVKLYISPITLGEVKVVSTKSERLIKDIPLPIEVLNTKQLEQKTYLTTSDALKSEAGVSLARDGIWGTHINIRGLSRQNIVTLVDGNRIETATNIAAGLSLIDVNDIERIEVIKGGVSSLYGSGAMGGVVNIKTKGGFYNDSFHVNGTLLSSFNSVNNGGIGNISINTGSESWYARISGTMRTADNTETPEGTLENSQFHDNNLSATLGIIPMDDHEFQINYQRFYAKDVGIPGGDAFPQTAIAKYPMEERLMYSAEYKIRNLFPSLVNTSIKYFHQLIKRNVEIIPNASVTTTTQADHNIDGIQLQINWLLDKTHFVSAGIDTWQRSYKGKREKEIRTNNQIIGETPIPYSKYRSIGLFAQDEIRLMENKLNVTLGGRFDQIKITNDEVLNPTYIITNGIRNDTPPSNPQASFTASENDNVSWSGNLGFLYSVSSDVDLTFNTAYSFRSPTLEERFQYIDLGGRIYLGNPELKPEKGFFIDAGIRIWKPEFNFRGNIYYNTFDNLVIDKEEIFDSLFVKNNVGKARLYGFDLSFEYNFYNDAVFYGTTSFVRGEDTGNNLDIPEIPPLNGRFGMRMTFYNYFDIDLSATIFSKQDKVAPGEEVTPGYTTFDIYVNTIPLDFSFAKFQVFAGIENLTNKAYRNHLATNRGSIRIEPGRNFFIKIKMEW